MIGFNTPNCPINPKASEITSIYYDKDSNIMTHRDQQVQHLPTHTILEGLLEFLSKVNSPVIVSHNGKRFDFIFLYRAAMSCELLTRFRDTLDTFMDTLPLSRTVLNYYRSLRLERIYKRMFKETFPSHDAEEDTKALRRITHGILERSDMDELHYCSFHWPTVMNYTFPQFNSVV